MDTDIQRDSDGRLFYTTTWTDRNDVTHTMISYV